MGGSHRGYYPKGGGEVVVKVNPVKELRPINMTERGNITKIYGRAFVAGVLPFKVLTTEVLWLPITFTDRTTLSQCFCLAGIFKATFYAAFFFFLTNCKC